MWVTNWIPVRVEMRKIEEELELSSYLLDWLRGSNELVYKLTMIFQTWIQNYFVCSHFYFYRLFQVCLSNSFKASQLFYYNWEIDVLRFIINAECFMLLHFTCTNGFALSFISSADISLRRNERYANFLRIILVL